MGTYLNQLTALLKRNILIKKASKSTLMMEIIFPFLMVFLSYFLNKMSETQTYDVEPPTDAMDLGMIFSFTSSMLKERQPVIGFILPPNSNNNTDIMNQVMSNEMFANSNIQPLKFDNEDAMNEYNNDYHNFLLAGIVFESDDYLQYTIRVNSTSAPDPTAEAITNFAQGRYQSENGMGTNADSYMAIFSPVQSAVDQAIIRLKTGDNSYVVKPQLGKLGKPASEYAQGSGNGNSIAAYIAIIFMIPIIVIVVSLVKEKEDGIKDGLLMAGVYPTVFWLSWLILYLIITVIISLFITIFYYFTKTFSNINPFALFFALSFYGLSCCTLGFVFSTFFKKSKTAGTVVSLIVVVLGYSNFFSSYLSMTIKKILSILFSPLAIGSFVYEINDMEDHFINFDFKSSFNTNAGYFLWVLVLNNVIYFILAVILDNLFSNENSRYLFMSKRNINNLHGSGEVTFERDIQEDFNAKNNEKCVVEVSRIHKIFKRKNNESDNNATTGDNNNGNNRISNKSNKGNEFLAVDDVSFKVYENEIFAILGHNGAGKTTLINIMVGLLKATEGDVYFDGRSISSDTNTIRQDFGVCAQTNIIYDELTVEDHINFFAGLKGVKVNVDEVLTELDLLQQKHLKASKLSGGQKRKLCIGMATIGKPKYVFLDEPTTGLDPLSRRRIWELLQKKREGKVIFLTTHYMDEADILADRKLILNKGRIRCLGTSLYLKNHFNMNYNLDVETGDQVRVNEIIQSYLPEASYFVDPEMDISDNGVKCHTWRLPLNSTSKFTPLLDELERQSSVEGKDQAQSSALIKKFALNMPTLEELFIRLEDDNLNDYQNNSNSEEQYLLQTNENKLPMLKEVQKPSRFSLLYNLVKYRLKIFLKDKGFAFYSIVFPIITTGLTFYFVNKFLFNAETKTSESRIISVPEIYGDSYINYDPQSKLELTSENFISVLGNNKNHLTNYTLNSIPFPKFGETYTLSSISGQSLGNNYAYKIHYNDTMTHSIPASINAVSNAILSSKNINGQIVVKSHPYDQNNDILAIIGLSIAGFIIGYSIVGGISKFGPLIVRERVNQLLQQLQLNGVSRFNYWISCFISDNSIYVLSSLLMVAVGVAVQFQPLMDIKILIILVICIVIWSIPTMLYQYVISFIFNKEETAYSMMALINDYSVLFGYFIFFFMNMQGMDNENLTAFEDFGLFSKTAVLYNCVVTFFFPAYGIVCIFHSLFTMKMYEKLINYDINFTNILKPLNGFSPIVVILIALIFILFSLLIRFDRMKNQTNKSDIHDLPENVQRRYEQIIRDGDDDVAKEFEYVKEHEKELPVSVYHLSKEYKVKAPNDKEKREEIMARDPENINFGEMHRSSINNKIVKTAVIDVNFGVRKHECFGLLGPNGAGKSTTLNTVTSTIPQTTGRVCFNGLETHIARLGEISMGYCPQNDILWKELTLREHLEFFLTIRGYSSEESKTYATEYINAAGLEEHQNKRIENLSGGTKRKLSLLIAICGYPKQILLDEPTAGMDPSTRRLVWNIIKKTKNMNDSALIMTTHSMEEAENLCDRLAILVNGRLTCIGSPEHLKMKFGEGYILEIQSGDVERFHHEIIKQGQLFGGNEYTMEKSSFNRSKYEVKMKRNLGHVFEVMEQCKANGLVTDYSFNQTSLEQIFINFAKQQIINTEN